MNKILMLGAFFSLILSQEGRACRSDSDCDGGQVCCHVDSWPDAQACGGRFLCGVGGGHCCVNSGCINGCNDTFSKEHGKGKAIKK